MPITLGPLLFAVLHYGDRYTFHLFEDMNFTIALSRWTVSQKKASRQNISPWRSVRLLQDRCGQPMRDHIERRYLQPVTCVVLRNTRLACGAYCTTTPRTPRPVTCPTRRHGLQNVPET
jgi:hypothetical protein